MTYAEGGAGGAEPDYSQRGRRTASVGTADVAHEEVRGLLTDLLAGDLDEAEAARIRGHLAECARCAAYYGTLRATIDLLGGLPTRAAPNRLRQRLLDIPERESQP